MATLPAESQVSRAGRVRSSWEWNSASCYQNKPRPVLLAVRSLGWYEACQATIGCLGGVWIRLIHTWSKQTSGSKLFRIIGPRDWGEPTHVAGGRNLPEVNTVSYGFSASSHVQTNFPQPGQPLPYFSFRASARSIPATFAMVASQAITSANSSFRS